MTALGIGAAIGVFTLLWLQRRLPAQHRVRVGVIGVGIFLVLAASFSTSAVAGGDDRRGWARARARAYVTGFTVLQENVTDELRGRTFATLYTVVRLCLLLSLTVSPLFADLCDWVTQRGARRPAVTVGPYSYALPGVRIALWGGGLITLVAGVWRGGRSGGRSRWRRNTVVPTAAMVERIEHGPEAPLVAPGLVEPTVTASESERRPTSRCDDPTVRPSVHVELEGDGGPVPTGGASRRPGRDPPTEELEGITEDPPATSRPSAGGGT